MFWLAIGGRKTAIFGGANHVAAAHPPPAKTLCVPEWSRFDLA
jgi:hypothetical protein